MLDPGLPPHQFKPDRLLLREPLYRASELATLADAEADRAGVAFRAKTRLNLCLEIGRAHV